MTERTADSTHLEEVRLQAHGVLMGLERDCRRVDQRLVDLGRSDPMREVTGLTALERAISNVESILERLDAIDPPPAPVIGRIGEVKPIVVNACDETALGVS
mgnify:CR=1 FL=1